MYEDLGIAPSEGVEPSTSDATKSLSGQIRVPQIRELEQKTSLL